MRRDKWQQTRRNNGQNKNSADTTVKCDTFGKPHKTEGCWNGANSANDPRPKRHLQQERKTDPSFQQMTAKFGDESKKLITPRLRFGETVDASAYSTEDPSTTYANDTIIECNGTPTEDWLRPQALASIRRPPPQQEKKEIYAQDEDYRGDRTHHIKPLVQSPLNTKDQSIATQVEQNENTPDDQLSSQSTEEDNYGATKKSIFPDNFPTSLNSINEYVTEKDGSTYIPLHSTIPLKKRQRMLYLPLEFGEITMDGLVDSGASINAMSWSDYNAIKMNSDNCIIKV